MPVSLIYSDEVAYARAHGQPIVALESTLITHGLPYPANRDTALAMEQAVRDAGAVPATIALLNGQVRVGLTTEQVDMLAQKPAGSVRKCSRRDLPIAIGLGEDAATTVAGTMIVAHWAGIPIFATGGIGGVHRGHPWDVSADLIELGRTPVAVICAGAKSILDLPLTLEVLETQGVPIIGFRMDTLPAFYTRSSGLPVDACVQTEAQAARIIHAAHMIEAQHGLLITVPVPEADALSAEVAEAAIEQATQEADAHGIHGKALTPYVLSRVVELTGGASLRANRALLINNAATAARIAVELAHM